MSTKPKGNCIHAFRVGTTWFHIWENKNKETGKSFNVTQVSHSYMDDKGVWQPTNNYSDNELADLEIGIREARQRLKIHDPEKSPSAEKDSQKKAEEEEGKFQKKVARKRAAKKAAAQTRE